MPHSSVLLTGCEVVGLACVRWKNVGGLWFGQGLSAQKKRHLQPPPLQVQQVAPLPGHPGGEARPPLLFETV